MSSAGAVLVNLAELLIIRSYFFGAGNKENAEYKYAYCFMHKGGHRESNSGQELAAFKLHRLLYYHYTMAAIR